MGVSFRVGANVSKILAPVWEGAKRKFWALKHLPCSQTPLSGRMMLFQSLVGGAALWCVATFSPEQQALENLNRIMIQMVIYMLRIRRKPGEEWTDFRKRGVRIARVVVFKYLSGRWSTVWLKRYWLYQGHVARGLTEDPHPCSTELCYHRTVHWWRNQQEFMGGERHSNRYFPKLHPLELNMDAAAGQNGAPKPCVGRRGN